MSIDEQWTSGRTRVFDSLSYNPELVYHSSALLASTLECASLSYRLKSNRVPLAETLTSLSLRGGKIAMMASSGPLNVSCTSPFSAFLNARVSQKALDWLVPLCPGIGAGHGATPSSLSAVVRGISGEERQYSSSICFHQLQRLSRFGFLLPLMARD